MSIFGTRIEISQDKTVKRLGDFFIRISFFAAMLVWVASCGKKTPEGILSKEEMVQIMQEVYIAEEKVNQLTLSRDSAKVVAAVMMTKVFEKAVVEDTVFRKSFDYYMERPREMELIYTALVDTLQLREQRVPFRPDQQ
jgi:hypothetical protein